MANPKYPIFIFDGFDLMVIASYERLQTDIESIDVRLGDFEVFDSKGRRVKLETRKWSGNYAEIDPQEPAAPEDFGTRLRNFLRESNNARADDPTCDLICLMDAAKKCS